MAKKNKPSDIKILILDKNEKRQSDIASRLRVQGYNSKSISEGFFAINMLESKREVFNLILINGDLEDMPGVEISTLLRDLFPTSNQPALVYFMDKGNEDSPIEIANLIKQGINQVHKETNNFNIILKLVKKFTNT